MERIGTIAARIVRRLLILQEPLPKRVKIELEVYEIDGFPKTTTRPPLRAKVIALDLDRYGEVLAVGLAVRRGDQRGQLVTEWLAANGYEPITALNQWGRS